MAIAENQPHLKKRVGLVGVVMFGAGTAIGVSIFSVLEPAAFGAPVIFGPRHEMSRDATLLSQRGGGVSVANETDMCRRMRLWTTDQALRQDAGNYARALVRSGIGAAERSFELVDRLLR